MNPVSVNCIWKRDSDLSMVVWNTDCWMKLTTDENPMLALKFKFCPYCGKPIVLVFAEEPVEECLYDYE